MIHPAVAFIVTEAKLTYVGIGHDPKTDFDSWVLMPKGQNIAYASKRGKEPEFFHDILGPKADLKGRIDLKKRQISVTGNLDRLEYAAKALSLDFPGYEIWYFSYGAPRNVTPKPGKKIESAAKLPREPRRKAESKGKPGPSAEERWMATRTRGESVEMHPTVVQVVQEISLSHGNQSGLTKATPPKPNSDGKMVMSTERGLTDRGWLIPKGQPEKKKKRKDKNREAQGELDIALPSPPRMADRT